MEMRHFSVRYTERWLSGRKRHPAKVLSPSRGSVGSNPTLSAPYRGIILKVVSLFFSGQPIGWFVEGSGWFGEGSGVHLLLIMHSRRHRCPHCTVDNLLFIHE